MIPTDMKPAIPPQPPEADDDDRAGPERPSKTQQKKAMHALQDLGEALVALSKEQLAQLTLPENLFEAVREAQRIKSHEGRRRQMQYLGKLMRGVDPEPIQQALDAWAGRSAAANAHFHALERWRERLLAEDDALTGFLAQYPQADAQQLRALIRNARKEQAEQRPPKSFRELFQVLKGLIEA